MIIYDTRKGKYFLLYFLIFHVALRKHRSVLGIHNINTLNSLSFTENINLEMHIAKPMLCQKKSMSL